MEEKIEAQVMHEITAAQNRILPWFDQGPEASNWVPPTGGWSITEILQHITLTSHYLLKLIDKGKDKCLKAKESGAVLSIPGNYELMPSELGEAGIFRSFQWHRPEHMDPRIHPPTYDVKEEYIRQMDHCEAVLQDLKGGWGTWAKTMMTVNAIGRIDVYQYIVFLCRHAIRHETQMQGNSALLKA